MVLLAGDIGDLVQGGWMVSRVLGCWPSFHDARVSAFSIVQSFSDKANVTNVLLSLVHFEISTDRRRLVSTCKITFCFENATGNQVSLDRVEVPMWVNDLEFSKNQDERIEVELDGVSGLGFAITCDAAKIVSIEPFSDATA